MYTIGEVGVAVCFFYREGDHRFKCTLTNQYIRIFYEGKPFIYPLETVKAIKVERKKMLFPLLYGGIMVPAGIIGFGSFQIGPMFSFLLIITGIFAFYMGWEGQDSLIVRTSQEENQFPLNDYGKNLREFIAFTNNRLSSGTCLSGTFLLPLRHPDPAHKWNHGIFPDVNTEVPLYDTGKIRSSGKTFFSGPYTHFMVIDPVRAGLEIRYTTHEKDLNYGPVAKGILDQKGIIGLFTYEELGNKLFDGSNPEKE